MADCDGPSGLGKFFAEIKRVSGITPVDELITSFTYYLNTFKQGPHESIRGHVERGAKIWERVQESVAQMDGSETIWGPATHS